MFFDEVKGKVRRERSSFVPMEYVKKDFAYYSDYELAGITGKKFAFDCEVYKNLFYIGFKCLDTSKVISLRQNDYEQLNRGKLNWLIWNMCLIGFNSNSYDIPVICVALAGYDCKAIKFASDMIIKQGATPRDVAKEFKVFIPNRLNHIDLIEVAPLEASLKAYAGRLHAPRMQDLPYAEDSFLTNEQAEITELYCLNDLDNTELLHNFLKPQLELRESLSEQYGIDLRSKSDAQIAEHVIVSEVKKTTGRYPRPSEFTEGAEFKYRVPHFVSYRTAELQNMLIKVMEAVFIIDENGRPRCPQMDELTVTVGSMIYKMGIGGLHSTEKSICHIATDEVGLFDRDVTGYYPRCILNSGMYPKSMGPVFLEVFQSIVDRRVTAKKNKDMVVADSLKITANGTFGKTGSSYSAMYEPELMIYVTLTGQLAILMLIELLEECGFTVISGNTDGIVSKVERSKYSLFTDIIKYWERITSFDTEETEYDAVYSRDVNNYIAIKNDGEVKQKGCYSEKGSGGNSVLSKNPENLICIDAVLKFLTAKIPIADTIYQCSDFRRFVNVRTVKGGAEKDGIYLGKVVRWYYAENVYGQISYILSGNKVPNSDGAKPCMDLPTVFPQDINYEWYINEADKILYEIGYKQHPKQERLV